MIRPLLRTALGGSLAAAAMLATATPAVADSVPPAWASSSATVSGTTVSGAVHRDGTWDLFGQQAYTVSVTITITPPAGLSSGCAVPPASGATGTRRVPFDRTLAFNCNGTYQVQVQGSANHNGGIVTMDRSIGVAMPAPVVTGVSAEPGDDDGDLVVRWDEMSGAAADLTGYRIERRVDDGAFEALESIDDPSTTRHTDRGVPADADAVTYRVVATRAGTTESPSSDASEASVDLSDPTDPTDPGGNPTDPDGNPTDPGGNPTDPGGNPGSGGSDGSGPGGSGAGGGGAARGGGLVRTPTGRVVRAPRVGTPSGTFFPPLLTPTVDAGFDESLDYDEEPGSEDAILPDDELASGVLGGSSPGSGFVIPVAAALVLALWAAHLRYLARAARPQYALVEVDELHEPFAT